MPATTHSGSVLHCSAEIVFAKSLGPDSVLLAEETETGLAVVSEQKPWSGLEAEQRASLGFFREPRSSSRTAHFLCSSVMALILGLPRCPGGRPLCSVGGQGCGTTCRSSMLSPRLVGLWLPRSRAGVLTASSYVGEPRSHCSPRGEEP